MILSACTGTIWKHVERILSKLCVENRTAAAAIALAALANAKNERSGAKMWLFVCHCERCPFDSPASAGSLRLNSAESRNLINDFKLWITQGGSAATKNLTTDLKLTRYPRSLAATLAAFPSVSLFPQLGSLITRIWIGRNASMASCTAYPPVCGKCGLAKAFGVGSARCLRIPFRSTAFFPKSDARTRAHSQSPATAGRNTTARCAA